MSEQFTGRIRIVRMPDGEAPAWIRDAWVGLILPCSPYMGYPDDGMSHGVLTGERNEANLSGFNVPQGQAIDLLELQRPTAAAWWRDHGFPKRNGLFQFGEECAEVVSGVTRQKIVQVQDDDQGNPFR